MLRSPFIILYSSGSDAAVNCVKGTEAGTKKGESVQKDLEIDRAGGAH